MSDKRTFGFRYALTDEVIRNYQAKPIELRLQWLYMGNLLRMHLPESTRQLHDQFRRGPTDRKGVATIAT